MVINNCMQAVVVGVSYGIHKLARWSNVNFSVQSDWCDKISRGFIVRPHPSCLIHPCTIECSDCVIHLHIKYCNSWTVQDHTKINNLQGQVVGQDMSEGDHEFKLQLSYINLQFFMSMTELCIPLQYTVHTTLPITLAYLSEMAVMQVSIYPAITNSIVQHGSQQVESELIISSHAGCKSEPTSGLKLRLRPNEGVGYQCVTWYQN